MGDTLKGKAAVVTGAGSGIGRALAMGLAAEGASVVVDDLGCAPDGRGDSNAAADGVVEEIRAAGGTAVPCYESVATAEGPARIIETVLENFGRIDVLVNNAGIMRRNMIWEMPQEDWDAEIGTHLRGTFACMKAVAPHFIKQKSGRIINISSDAGVYGSVGHMGYAASKAGIIGMTMTGALELGVFGVTVNALCPSAPSRLGRAYAWFKEKYNVIEPARLVAQLAEGPQHEDVAPIVVYLARDQANDINGQVFRAWSGNIALVAQRTQASVIHTEGRWTQDELTKMMPVTLARGLVNISPLAATDPPVWHAMTE